MGPSAGGIIGTMPSLDDLLRGPHLRLPRPLDALSERWSRLRPRVRSITVWAAALLGALALQARVTAAESRWGGPPRTVLVAAGDLPVGAAADAVLPRALPPAAVPPAAVAKVPPGAVLALALPEGAVLTEAHLDRRGPAAGLAEGLRAVPIPSEDGWGVVPGGWVDVWVLGAGDMPAQLVAESRPVLEVNHDDAGSTALVGLEAAEVGPANSGLALGRVLLAHAPPP